MIAIDPCLPSDRAALAQFLAAIQEHERARMPELKTGAEIGAPYAALIARLVLERDGVILMARADEEAIGMASAWVEMDENPLVREDARRHAYLSDLYVAPAWRRQGVSRRLVEAVETEMARRGCRTLRLGVKANNAEALAHYAAAGFRPHEIILSKTIGP